MARVRVQPPADERGDYPAPDGYRVEWIEPDRAEERLATPEEALQRKCRRPGCQWVVAWALLRRHGRGRAWWFYCRHHHYGRKIEGGRLLRRRLVPEDGEA